MKRRVVVTGIGAVTSLGLKVEELWRRVLRGDSGIGPISLFDTSGADMTGHPFKVHVKTATVRYMFFNRGAFLCFLP